MEAFAAVFGREAMCFDDWPARTFTFLIPSSRELTTDLMRKVLTISFEPFRKFAVGVTLVLRLFFSLAKAQQDKDEGYTSAE